MQPPTSRLPRLATPTKSAPSLRPPSVVGRPAPLGLAMTVAGEKRKTPSSPVIPTAKRTASGPSALGKSTLTKPTASTARKASGSAAAAPTGRRPATRSSTGSTGSTPPSNAAMRASSRSGSALATSGRRTASGSSSASSTATTTRTRPAVAPPTRGVTASRAGGPARKLPISTTAAGPSRPKPVAGKSGIGTGMASAAQFKVGFGCHVLMLTQTEPRRPS